MELIGKDGTAIPRTWDTTHSTAPGSEGCVTPELLITLGTQQWCLPTTGGCQTPFCVALYTVLYLACRNWSLQPVPSAETG